VTKFNLTSKSPLNGYSETIAGVVLEEVPDLNITSIATPLGGEKKRDAAFKKLGFETVAAGKSVRSKTGRLIGMAVDQHFLVYGGTPDLGLKDVYTTDQTHNWVALRAIGPNIWPALERLCMLDLHPDTYLTNDAIRFDIETMMAIMVKEADDQVLILGASSSAKSFVHAIETALHSIG